MSISQRAAVRRAALGDMQDLEETLVHQHMTGREIC